MAIQDDWAVNYAAKTITHNSGTTIYSVNAFYSWLSALFDDLAQMDDPVPMEAPTPIDYTFINGWTFGTPSIDIQFLNGGAITDTADDTVWVNVYSDGSLVSGSSIYIEQNGALLTSFWPTDHVDILVKVKNAGTWIDNGNLTFYSRESGDLFAWTTISAQSGRKVAFLQTENDRNDDGTGGAVTGVTLAYAGPYSEDVDGNGATNYDTQIDCGGNTLLDTYMYLKDLVKEGSVTSVDGVDGQFYQIAGVGYTAITKAPFGEYAGGKFFGARGILLINMHGDDSNSYELIDSAGVTKVPPTTVSITIDKVEVGDKVSVYRLNGVGGTIDKAEYTLNGIHNVGSTSIVVNEVVKVDTPSSGQIIVNEDILSYTAVDIPTKTFTVASTASSYADAASTYVPFIIQVSTGTSVSNQLQFDANIPILIRVRLIGIKPFEIESTITNTGATVSAIRNDDNIVTI